MENFIVKKNECLCGSNKYSRLFFRKDKKHNFGIFKCNKCGLVRTFPIPDYSKKRYSYYGAKRYLKNRKIAYSFMEIIFKKIKKIKKEGRLLEIGCSVGYLLKIAKDKGFFVRGVELDKKAVKYANKILGKGSVQEIELEKAKFPKGYFDVIAMSHFLEHIKDPIILLKEIKRILKDKGIIIIAGPSFNSFCAKIKKEKWPGLQPKEHVWQFGTDTLKKILEESGFKVIKIRNLGLYHNLFSVIKSINENFKSKGSLKHIIYSFFNWFCGKINKGDNMLIIAKKHEKKS